MLGTWPEEAPEAPKGRHSVRLARRISAESMLGVLLEHLFGRSLKGRSLQFAVACSPDPGPLAPHRTEAELPSRAKCLRARRLGCVGWLRAVAT